jgi:hypothetical protein
VTPWLHHDPVAISSSERTGVLVLRVWTQGEGALRARISTTVDLDATPARTAVAISIDDIRAIVAEFLTAFANRSGRGATSP